MVKCKHTTQDVKEQFGEDFSKIRHDNYENLISWLPSMEEGLAPQILMQLSDYSANNLALISCCQNMWNSICSQNSRISEKVLEGYQSILNTLQELAKTPKLKPQQQQYFVDKMIQVANKMAEIDKANKSFLLTLVKYLLIFGGGGAATASAVVCIRKYRQHRK